MGPQTGTGHAFDTSPPARAERLAARVSGRSQISLSTALHEISILDSGTLTALPAVTQSLNELLTTDPLPPDPLRQLIAKQPAGWSRRLPWRSASRAPQLNEAAWTAWQADVRHTSERLARHQRQLSELQARQAQLLHDLHDDAQTLTLTASMLSADEALTEPVRQALVRALQVRVAELQTAVVIVRQTQAATDQLAVHHAELQGRLTMAAQLIHAAAQTGMSLQQVMNDWATLNDSSVPPLSPLPDPGDQP
ncbi:hypothetical protein [Deinococcus sonorensis]|uniref:ANTAR domain-containing protein n=2 Tax=Deinococcus sonorensis TaxID=309891 RepID=A0AAU7U5U3_9DEIO